VVAVIILTNPNKFPDYTISVSLYPPAPTMAG